MNKKNLFSGMSSLTSLIFVISSLYFIALIFDVPFIRGFYDPVFPSEWPYYYVNTWSKIWLPVVSFLVVITIFIKAFNGYGKWDLRKRVIFWIVFTASIFILHLSYVFFSRFGITILFQRLVNPGMNGYFSSAIRVDTNYYLTHFPDAIETLDQHARDHPPGSILFIKSVMYVVDTLKVSRILLPFIPIPDGDVKVYWNAFTDVQRTSAVIIAVLFHFFAASIVFLMYLISRIFYNEKTSLALSLFCGFIPSVSFFALKFDPLYVLIFMISMYLLFMGTQKNSSKILFIAGITSSIAVFFSYSVIPAFSVIAIYFIFPKNKKIGQSIWNFTPYLSGLLSFILVMLFFGYNSFTSFFPIISNQAPRSYLQWLIYNPFDFFQYFGVPLFVFFIFSIVRIFKIKTLNEEKKLTLAFLVLFTILVASGVSRAEVGRIWMPLMVFPLIAVGSQNIHRLKTTIMIVFLLFLQIILMTEYWVPVW